MSNGVTPKQVEALGRRHLMLFAGRASRELANEVARHLGIECGSVEIRDFANGEIYARFGESVRGTDVFVIQTHSAPVERADHGAADHDRRRQAGVGQADHRRRPLLRLRPPGPQGRGREPITAKLVADMLGHGRGRPAHHHRPALRADPGVLRRAGRPPDGHAGAGRLHPHQLRGPRPGGGRPRRRPGQGGRADGQPARRRPGLRAQAAQPHRGPQGRGPRGGRRGRGPAVRADRRHDRHRRHHRAGRRAADGQRRRPGDGRRHPRRLLRPGHRPAQERPHRRGRGHQHPAAGRRTSRSTRSRCSRWPASSPTPSRRCSRTPASPRSSTTRTSSEPFAAPCRASMLTG